MQRLYLLFGAAAATACRLVPEPVHCKRYNRTMKVWILFVSLMAAMCVWQWGPHRRQSEGMTGWRRRARQISQSLLAGVATYFSIMSLAMLYLMLTRA